MKKIMKSRIFLVILTAIIVSSVTVYAVTYEAKDINYKTNVSVKDALDDLYTNRKLGTVVLAGHGENSYSSSVTTETKITGTVDDGDTLEISNNTFTIKKAGTYLIEYAVGSNINSESAASYSGHIKLYVNNQQIDLLGQSYSTYYVKNHIANLNVGDTIHATYYGNGGSYQKKSLYKVYYVK